jgi:glycerophosphoryl diester phosphodiesterase
MNKDFLIIAHRGDSSLCPENTMAAFRKAVEVGSDGIETDVHLTKDGKVVISHDGYLGRVCNGKGNISDYTYDELKKFDAGSWFSEDFKGERLPLLEELLDLLKDKDMILNIEIKEDRFPMKA